MNMVMEDMIWPINCYLINAYKNDFALIDEIIVYLKYENDLNKEILFPKFRENQDIKF